MALYLARQGCDVTVYEARPDIRRVAIPAGRSIPDLWAIRASF